MGAAPASLLCRPRNLLLGSLSKPTLDALAPHTDIIALKFREILHRPGEHVSHLYFPGGGFCSVLTMLNDGNMVEVATVGAEGLLGMPHALNHERSPSVTMVQAETDVCYRMSGQGFRLEMAKQGEFFRQVSRFHIAFAGFLMQSAACNARHTVEQRLARWLLLASDRLGSLEFPLTQELVAMMLGASRPTVTIVAGVLQKSGLIQYHRGMITILSRELLMDVACECYATTSRAMARVYRPTSEINDSTMMEIFANGRQERTPALSATDPEISRRQ